MMTQSQAKLLRQFLSIMDSHHKLEEGYLYGAWLKYKAKYGKPEKVKSNRPSDIQEVIAYFLELKIAKPHENANKFYNHYEAVDWVRGKTKIRNWKACVKTWDFQKEVKKMGINLTDYNK